MKLKLVGTILVIIIIIFVICMGYFFLKGVAHPRLSTSPVASLNQSDEPKEEGGWIYPHSTGDKQLWGSKNGIIVGTPESAMDYNPGGAWAEGLLRVGWTDNSGSSHFFNYLGITILSKSRKFDTSELEKIQFFPDSPKFHENLEKLVQEKGETSGEVQNYLDLVKNPPAPIPQATTINENSMSVLFRLSEFKNSGSRIYLILTIDRKNPGEIKISSYNPLQGTNQLEYIGLSSTYGNLGRLRNLYLKDSVVNANDLFRSEAPGIGCFYPYYAFRVNELPVDADGIIVYAGNNEEGTWAGDLGNNAPYYGGKKFFQYWRKYAGSYRDDLSVRVNARENYFGGFINQCGGKKITGGISYENFEMNERYYPGQTFWFGYTYEK